MPAKVTTVVRRATTKSEYIRPVEAIYVCALRSHLGVYPRHRCPSAQAEQHLRGTHALVTWDLSIKCRVDMCWVSSGRIDTEMVRIDTAMGITSPGAADDVSQSTIDLSLHQRDITHTRCPDYVSWLHSSHCWAMASSLPPTAGSPSGREQPSLSTLALRTKL
jgi:hypothetical protein